MVVVRGGRLRPSLCSLACAARSAQCLIRSQHLPSKLQHVERTGDILLQNVILPNNTIDQVLARIIKYQDLPLLTNLSQQGSLPKGRKNILLRGLCHEQCLRLLEGTVN